jgi:ATP-dependent helicase HrpB
MKESPRIGATEHLLMNSSPPTRVRQTTTDLAGFWQRLYPQLRRELSRRYPAFLAGKSVDRRPPSRR